MFKVYLDIQTWAYASSKINNNVYQLSNVSVISGTQLEFNNIRIVWDSTIPAYTFQFKQNATIVAEYHGNDLVHNIDDLLITASPSYTLLEDILLLEKGYFIDMVEMVADVVDAITYKLNDELDVLNKTLTPMDAISGNFNNVVGTKNLDLDINYVDAFFNYIYIPIFKRFYYVTSTEMLSADYVRVHLKEDVLMSWKDLIKQQEALITRYGAGSSLMMVDSRLPIDSVVSVTYTTPTMRSTNLINTTLSANPSGATICVCTVATSEKAKTKYAVGSPTNSGLPEIGGTISELEHTYFIGSDEYNLLYYANMNDSGTATYVESVVWFPFDTATPFNYGNTDTSPIYASDKMLFNDEIPATRWVDISAGYTADIIAYESVYAGSPYLIIADFDFKTSGGFTFFGNFLDYEPYSVWEMYIPFVGWVQLPFKDLYYNRILVYYVVDIHSGQANAYVYNHTDKKVIWSGSCQMGIQLPLTNTNALELQKQQQANQLNMIMSLIGSAVSVGVGMAKHNPVAIAGGVMAGVKGIASAVNNEMMMIDKAMTSFGSSDGGLHSPLAVSVRCTYHEELLTSSDETIYKKINGLPFNRYKKISDLTTGNYIEVGEIHFNPKNELIYQDEIDEIVSLLKNGVII